jgi:hypothetical protein
MNIIKLKDQIMPDVLPYSEYFNKYLKGKYAYWVQMRYIVSFDHMRHEGYVACEEDISKLLQRPDGTYPKPYGAPAIDVYDKYMIEFVDAVETDRINNTTDFRLKNVYATDPDVTVAELKLFRTWLAKKLLKMDKSEFGDQRNYILSHIETHVLEYYAADMYDNTVKILSSFNNDSINKLTDNTLISNCNCHHNSNLSSLYNTDIKTCDPIAEYKKNIYNNMVNMFSNISFWTRFSKSFIGEIKKYIDNIIRCNFPLSKSIHSNKFVDCSSLDDQLLQQKYIDILKDLSTSLGYIENDQIIGHKNYINDSLLMWSNVLYENMKW